MTTFPLGINKIRSVNVDTDINVVSNVESLSGKREVILGDQIKQTIQLNTTPLTESEDRQFQVFLKKIKNYGLIELPLSNLSVFKPLNNLTGLVTTLGSYPVGANLIGTITTNTNIDVGSYIQFNNVDITGPRKIHQVTGVTSVVDQKTFTKVIATIASTTSTTITFVDDESNNLSANDTIATDNLGSNPITITSISTDGLTITTADDTTNYNTDSEIFLQTVQNTRDLIISPGLDTAIANETKINYTNLIGQFRADNGEFSSQSGTLLNDGTTTKTYRFRLTEEI